MKQALTTLLLDRRRLACMTAKPLAPACADRLGAGETLATKNQTRKDPPRVRAGAFESLGTYRSIAAEAARRLLAAGRAVVLDARGAQAREAMLFD